MPFSAKLRIVAVRVSKLASLVGFAQTTFCAWSATSPVKASTGFSMRSGSVSVAVKALPDLVASMPSTVMLVNVLLNEKRAQFTNIVAAPASVPFRPASLSNELRMTFIDCGTPAASFVGRRSIVTVWKDECVPVLIYTCSCEESEPFI